MKFFKTRCIRCQGKIEFPSHGAGEWIQCPHCSEDTLLRKRFPKLWASLAGLLVAVLTIPMLLETHRVHVYRATVAQMESQQQAIPKPLDFSDYGEPVYPRYAPVRPSIVEVRRQSAESTRMRHFQDDLLAEMRRANQIADDAVWESRRQRIQEPPTISLPHRVTVEFDPLETLRRSEEQQALEGIQYELRRIRRNEEFNSYNSFPRVY